ncbi:MAG: guanylate kinase [Actinomycetota bacterium]|nr:guanylate kinase [Actinomycetota bacterium]
MPEGRLVVVSGPSGVGKSSVIDAVLEQSGARFSVSATTRAPRPGEIDGEDYQFVDQGTFADLVESGGMLEWAEYGGNRYGTPRGPVLELLDQGVHVVLDIENDGAHQVKRAYPSAVLLFLMPPSRAELERRLRSRGDTSDRDIEARLAVADEQMLDARESYDHLVVNDDLETAIYRVVSILREPATSDEDSDAFRAAGDAATTRSDTE